VNALNRRIAMVGALVLLASFITFSNFIDKEKRLESAFLVDDGLRLGLDLQGGIHWVLGVELETALKRELEFQRDSLVEFLEKDGVVPSKALVAGEALQLSAANPEDAEKIRTMTVNTNILNEEGSSGNDLNFVLTDEWKQEIRERTMLQVLEVLRRRRLHRVVLRLEGLDDGRAAVWSAPYASGHLRQYLKCTFARPKVRYGQSGVRRDHADKRDLWNIQPLSHHLSTDKNSGFSFKKLIEYLTMRPCGPRHITVPSKYADARESSFYLGHYRLRPAAHWSHVLCVTGEALVVWPDPVTAVMTDKAVDTVRHVRAMHRQRCVTSAARAYRATLSALDECGGSPSIQK